MRSLFNVIDRNNVDVTVICVGFFYPNIRKLAKLGHYKSTFNITFPKPDIRFFSTS